MKGLLSGLCLLVLLLTNRWMPWAAGIKFLTANDVFSYMSIMERAPEFPKFPLSFHHAQRFVGPYLLGLLARYTSIPYQVLGHAFALLYLGLVVGLMHRICLRFNLSLFGHGLCMGLLILNPYLFRYYLIVPGMLPDLVFVLGLTLTLLGLVERWQPLVLLGVGVAACGRQTVLMLLPGLWFWLLLAPGWFQRWRMAIGVTAISLGVYKLTGAIATDFALPSTNLEHLLGLITWLASPTFSLSGLLEHLFRLVTPECLILGAFIGIASVTTWQFSVEAWASWIMAVCISAQPFLAGPVITGANASRLSALGVCCGIVAIAAQLRHLPNPPWNRQLAWKGILVGSILLASLHHLYTWIGPVNASQFAILQLGLGAIAGYTVHAILDRDRDVA